ACRRRIDANETTRLELELVTVDTHRARALHDEVDLFHVRIAMVVLEAFLVRREDEVVEAESLRVERAADFPHHAARAFRFELSHIDDVIRGHYSSLSRLSSRCANACRRRSPSASTCL